uniref:F-box domain-containing protein n=1 Tax=Globodera rostochiensis TaxID=31243 RepID=A0A914HCT0_GLORO
MPPPEKKCKRQSATIFICAEVLLNIFRCLGHAELGLKIALISCRFNALVDKHFGDNRKWTLGWLEIRSSEDGTDAAELFKKNEYGNFIQLPFPQRASPDNIIGFERIFINTFSRRTSH